MRRPVPLLLTLVLLVCAPALAACGGGDTQGGPSTIPDPSAPDRPVALNGVATNLDLDPQTVGILDDNNVSITPIPPARRSALGIRFPIVGGEVRPDSLDGRIEHAGGIALSDGVRRISLRRLIIDTRTGQLTADAGSGRLPILNLDFASGKRLDVGGVFTLGNIPVKLAAGAAAAIDEALRIPVLTASIPIGFATVRATG